MYPGTHTGGWKPGMASGPSGEVGRTLAWDTMLARGPGWPNPLDVEHFGNPVSVPGSTSISFPLLSVFYVNFSVQMGLRLFLNVM